MLLDTELGMHPGEELTGIDFCFRVIDDFLILICKILFHFCFEMIKKTLCFDWIIRFVGLYKDCLFFHSIKILH